MGDVRGRQRQLPPHRFDRELSRLDAGLIEMRIETSTKRLLLVLVEAFSNARQDDAAQRDIRRRDDIQNLGFLAGEPAFLQSARDRAACRLVELTCRRRQLSAVADTYHHCAAFRQPWLRKRKLHEFLVRKFAPPSAAVSFCHSTLARTKEKRIDRGIDASRIDGSPEHTIGYGSTTRVRSESRRQHDARSMRFRKCRLSSVTSPNSFSSRHFS